MRRMYILRWDKKSPGCPGLGQFRVLFDGPAADGYLVVFVVASELDNHVFGSGWDVDVVLGVLPADVGLEEDVAATAALPFVGKLNTHERIRFLASGKPGEVGVLCLIAVSDFDGDGFWSVLRDFDVADEGGPCEFRVDIRDLFDALDLDKFCGRLIVDANGGLDCGIVLCIVGVESVGRIFRYGSVAAGFVEVFETDGVGGGFVRRCWTFRLAG